MAVGALNYEEVLFITKDFQTKAEHTKSLSEGWPLGH